MQNIADRLKILRKSLNLNQTEFGEKLGVTRSVIKNLELGAVEVKEHMLKLICSVFNVDEDWLRTGNGEMSRKNDAAILAAIAEQYDADETDLKILEIFLKMPKEQRDIFKTFVLNMANNFSADKAKAADAPGQEDQTGEK